MLITVEMKFKDLETISPLSLNQSLQFQSTCGQTRHGMRSFIYRTPLLKAFSLPNNCLVLCSSGAGFSTASYLKVHIKTHHGSPLPPSATLHNFPEPRGELQMHNGTPYNMGRQCAAEGKQPPAPSQTVMSLAFICSATLFFFFL